MKRIEKLVEVYQADDGESFTTEKACLEYETCLTDTAIYRLNTLISKEPGIESIFTPSEMNMVSEFIQKRFDDIRTIMEAPVKKGCIDEWIPHVNWDKDRPPVDGLSVVQVEFYNGRVARGRAYLWGTRWNTTRVNSHGRIVKYRIMEEASDDT